MSASAMPREILLEDAAPLTRIEPSAAWPSLRLKELVQSRELLYFLVWRDIKVRYKHTMLGAGWVVLQPLLTMAVFSLFLGRLAKMPSDGIPYPLFSLAGLVPWMFFANGLGLSSASLIANSNLIRKVYFPRLMIPRLDDSRRDGRSGAVGGAPRRSDAVLRRRRNHPRPFGPCVPYAGGAHLDGCGTMAVRPHDPIPGHSLRGARFSRSSGCSQRRSLYPTSLLAQRWHALYGLNPMVGAIEGFRWALLSTGAAPGPMLYISAGSRCDVDSERSVVLPPDGKVLRGRAVAQIANPA